MGKLFAMYERLGWRTAMARCEAHQVPALAAWVQRWEADTERLIREALQPPAEDERAVLAALALTDFSVWRALTSRGMSSQAAADLVSQVLLAWLGRQPDKEGRWEASVEGELAQRRTSEDCAQR